MASPARRREARSPGRWQGGAWSGSDGSEKWNGTGMVTNAQMWGIWTDAATMLDAADCDWRALQQVEGLLSSLSTEIEQVTRVDTLHPQNGSSSRHADFDLRALRGSLAWVRRNEYDALESELHQQLDTALRCALRMLDRQGQPQHETPLPLVDIVSSDDGQGVDSALTTA